MLALLFSTFVTSCFPGFLVGASTYNGVMGGNANSGGGNNLQQQFLQGYANSFWSNYNSNPQQYQSTPVTTTSSTSTGTSTTTTTTSPKTYQKSCPHCLGSGKCSTCNGSGQVTRLGIGSGTHRCPNCTNQRGACQWCRGSGKRSWLKICSVIPLSPRLLFSHNSGWWGIWWQRSPHLIENKRSVMLFSCKLKT